MAVVHAIQPSFAGGEFAPSLQSRVDLQKYATGAKTLKNFIVHPHGGASNRPGLKFIAATKFTTGNVRAVAFEFSTEQAYVIEFGHLYCRFFMNRAQIQMAGAAAWLTATGYVVGDFRTNAGSTYYCLVAHTSGTFATDLAGGNWALQSVYEIPTPYDEADLPALKFAQSADVLYICHPDYAPETLERLSNTSWLLTPYVHTDGPFMLSNATPATVGASAKTGSVTLTASVATFDSDMVGSLFRLHHDVAGSAVAQAFTGTGTSSTIDCGTTWRIITHGTWAAKFKIEQSTDNGGSWTEVRSFSGASDFNANTFGEVDEFCLIRINVYAFTSGVLNLDLTSDPFDRAGIALITAYSDSTHVTATVQSTLGGTAAVTDWAEGAWSDLRGYPSCCTFFEDRLVFGGTPTEPQTLWMTETGNYNSFVRSDPLEDSDGITINLPSRKINAVRSLVSLKNILALTSASEWNVGPGADGVLTPASVSTQINGYRGCNLAEPVVVGNQAIFVQPKGSVVRDLGYDYQSTGFTGNNISLLSNHLFSNYAISEIAYQQEPDSLVWAVRSDGVLLSMTYLREHEVVAWTRHETDGQVKSICCIPGVTYDELWAVVARGTSRFIELLTERLVSTDPRDQFFLDAGITYDSPIVISGATKASPVVITATAHGLSSSDQVDILNVEGMEELNGRRYNITVAGANSFSLQDEDTNANVDGTAYTTYTAGGEARLVATAIGGLSHLNGKTVKILADGNVQPSKLVAGGSVTLSTPASIVHIGLGYTCDLETLNVELGLRDGTTQGRKVRVAECILRFLDSRGGWVGPNAESLREIVQRTSEPLGSPVELFSGDVRMNLPPSYGDGGKVFYRQEDPLPVTILAVMPILSVGG